MENSNKTIQVLLCSVNLSGKHLLFLAAVNYFLSITAILGNAVIQVALHKESFLHPPSKLLCSCLAVTDHLAGIVSQLVVAVYFTSIGLGDDNLFDLCMCALRNHCCPHFCNSNCSVHAKNGWNKCGQTPRSFVGVEIQARRNFKASSRFSLLFLKYQHCLYFDDN